MSMSDMEINGNCHKNRSVLNEDVAVNVKCLNEDDSEDNVLGNFLGMDGDRMSYSGGLAYNSDSEMNDTPVVAVNGDDDAGSSNNHGTIWTAPPGLSIMSSGMGDGDMYQGAYDGDDSMNNSLDGMMGTDPTEMTAARLYNCEMCDKSFNHEKSLKDHQKRHLGITYKCEMCFKVFTEKKNLRKHQYSHVGNNFHCPECEEGFEEKIHLIRHSLQHVNKQSYLCEGCEQVLVAMPNLNIHNETCHSSVQMFYICILCHFRCSDIDQLTLHHDYHTVKPKKTKTPTKGRRAVGHQCPDCEHVAESSAALKLHRETEHKGIKYYCEKCSKSYSSLNSLRKHKCQIVAPPLPKPTKFECEICGKIFPRIYSKNRHMLSHSNEKKFPCVLCDKKFNRSDKFLQHLRIKHHIDRALYDETISRMQHNKNSLSDRSMLQDTGTTSEDPDTNSLSGIPDDSNDSANGTITNSLGDNENSTNGLDDAGMSATPVNNGILSNLKSSPETIADMDAPDVQYYTSD